jgi:sugar lactone lactonase YvrE
MIDLELSIVRPLAYNCLSYPSGLAISKNEKIIYVSETAKNRIIRFVLSPQGIYYYSNFV